MPTLRTQYQDPDAELEREIEFSAEVASGVTIATAVWSATPTDVPLTIGTPTNSGTRTKAKISGGAHGTTYTVTVEVTCSNAEILVRRFYLRVTRQ